MPLISQTIPVQFTGGLDQKTAEHQVIPGKFLVLENCIRRKTGKIQKRYGYDQLGTEIIGGASIDSGTRLAKLNNDLLLINNDAVYSYSASNDKWIDKNSISSALVTSTPMIRNSYIQATQDLDSINGITVAAWEDSRGGIGISVVENETGASIIYDLQIDAAGTKPKVVAANSSFLVMYRNSSDYLTCITIDSANPTTVSSPIVMDATAIDTYDACSHGIYAIVAAVPSTATTIKVSYYTSAGVLGSGANGLPTTATINEVAVDTINITSDYDNSKLYVAYKGSANNLKVAGFTSPLLITATATIENLSDISNIGCCIDADDALQVYYEVADTETYDHLVKSATVEFTGGSLNILTAAAIFKRSVGLASKPFLENDRVFVNCAFETPLQPTYFTIRDDGFIVARVLSELGGGLTKDPSDTPISSLCRVVSIDGVQTFLAQIRLKLRATEDGTILSTARGLEQISLAFDSASYFSDQVGQNLHISGGVLLSYDGVSATEAGFHVYPEILEISKNGSGGAITGGDYLVTAIYEWIDAQGQIHRSAPTVPVPITSVANNGTIQIDVVSCLRLTNKTAPRSEAKIVFYRTEASGIQVFYRDVEITNNPSLDIPAAPTILSQSDADLALNEVLYTVGGILENTPPPASSTAVRHKNRLFLGGVGDGSTLAYSKQQVFGEGTAFSDAFTIPVEPGSGAITALASMDDKLVVFKRDRIYAFVGDGPLETGAQNDFTLPQIITSDVGAIDQASIVIAPKGIMFKSDKGIYMLSRSLELVYIGAAVEDFNNLTITSAILLENDNEVRFTTSDGQALVYNYYFDQWSTFTNYTAVSAINALGSYCHLTADGQVRQESTAYLDAGGRYSMAIETSWLAFAGVQGYQRLRGYAFLGDYVSDHYTKVKLAYNYEDAFTETFYFNVDEDLDVTYYGDDATYGSSTIYGGSGHSIYQFQSVPRRQKCQSVKFRLEDIDTKTSAGGGSFNLTSLTLDVGVKQGINRTATMKGSN